MFNTADMLRIFQTHRGDAIVISGRGGSTGQDQHAAEPRPPARRPGDGRPCVLRARASRWRCRNDKVVLFDSEGDIQMSLGILMTIAEQKPANFYHFMLDNECYATTGGQPVPNAKNVTYDQIARGCGYPRAFAFDELEDFQANIARSSASPGPCSWPSRCCRRSRTSRSASDRAGRRARGVRVLEDLRAELGITP